MAAPPADGKPPVDHGAAPVRDGADGRGGEHLGHGDARDVLDVEAADPEDRGHVVEERDHHDRAADTDEAGDEGPDEPEHDQGDREGQRHGVGRDEARRPAGALPEARIVARRGP